MSNGRIKGCGCNLCKDHKDEVVVEVAITRGKTDKELLDFLQGLNDKAAYTGKCVARHSTSGRGWRLHESSVPGYASVREAIAAFMEQLDGKEVS
ncbi:MAG: hypothetical protein KAJ19_30075 [Gammaproteobacteria bacterium]|nr:hypothetical protein [Gammaproteobacteria bacterium]